MKKLFALTPLALTLLAGAAYSQPSSFLARRLNEAAALFRSDPGGYDTLFTASFLNQVPKAQLNAISAQYFQSCGTVTRWQYLDSSKTWSAKVRLFFSKQFSIDMMIAVEEKGNHLIQGLQMGAPTPLIKSLSAIADTLGKLRGTAGFLAAKIVDGKLQPVAELHGDRPFALGSAFKLYVLATLLKEINSGKRHWNDVVELDSVSRAFPSGEMYAWPIGSPVTLATAATLMISISDNSATDLLINTLGREKIEAILQEAGNTHPERDMPFLTTLEMFKLKSKDLRLGHRYEALSRNERRAFLAHEVLQFPHDSVTLTSEVAMIDSVEWFASPRDIANVLIYLRDHSTSGEGARVRDILGVNPGLQFDKNQWEYIGYKGGSEPGVLNLSFLLRSKSGGWYILTGSWNDTKVAVDDETLSGLMQRAAELLK